MDWKQIWSWCHLISIKKIIAKDGFTLLEVLISLSVTSLCFLLLSISVIQIRALNDAVKTDKQAEWHLFLNQLEYYLIDSQFVSNSGTVLTVEELVEGNFNTVQYQRSGTRFIRKLNGGNQPLLMNVHKVTIKDSEGSLLIEGIFEDGESYKARIWVSSWNEEVNSE